MSGRFSLVVSAAVAVLVVSGAADHAAAQPALDNVRVEGGQTFSQDQIRKALRRDLDVQLAAHPRSPFFELPTTLREKLTAGYLHAGFAKARVAVVSDREPLTFRVDEGPRFLCGPVEIRGARELPVDRLQARLTEEYPPKDAHTKFVLKDGAEITVWVDRDGANVSSLPPIWKRGEPAKLDPRAKQSRIRSVQQALIELGYPSSTFQLDYDESPAGELTLVVDVQDEGPRATIRDIVIRGHEINSESEILDFLQLQPGIEWDRAQQVRVAHALWACGRFAAADLMTRPSEDGSGHVLELQLREVVGVPPLSQPLGKEEQTLLLARDWLSQMHSRSDNLVFRITAGGFRGTVWIAPHEGMLTQVQGPGDVPILTMAMTPELNAVFLPTERVKFEVDKQVMVNLTVSLLPHPKEERKSMFNLGFGWKTPDEEDTSNNGVHLELNLSPAAFLTMAHHVRESRFSWDGPLMRMSMENEEWCIDSRTGEILYVEFSGEDVSGRIEFQANALNEQLARQRELARDYAQRFDAQRPITSMVRMVLNPLNRTLAAVDTKWDGREKLNAILRLAEAGVFEPIDQLVVEKMSRVDQAESGKDKFSIPLAPGDSDTNYAAVMGRIGMYFLQDAIPRDGWSWTVLREACLSLAGKGRYAQQELESLVRDSDTGPLAHLALSWMYRKHPVSQLIATHGLNRNSPELMLKDCQSLLDEDYPVGKVVYHLARTMRQMDTETLAQFDKYFTEGDERRAWQAFVGRLRRHPSESMSEAIQAGLSAAWKAGLQQILDDAMKHMANPDRLRLSWQWREPRAAGRWF